MATHPETPSPTKRGIATESKLVASRNVRVIKGGRAPRWALGQIEVYEHPEHNVYLARLTLRNGKVVGGTVHKMNKSKLDVVGAQFNFGDGSGLNPMRLEVR